jgi:hypothetical protein
METEQAEQLRLASSYDSMASSLAFKHLIAWMEDATEESELRAANVPPEEKEHFHEYFMLWQQRKLIVTSVKAKVQSYIEYKQQLEEEMKNERPNDLGYASSGSGDYTLPGY